MESIILIAEAGTGHHAYNSHLRLKKAQNLVEVAANCGADAVKFQLFTDDELFCPMGGDKRRWKRWSKTLMPFDDWVKVKKHCDIRGIDLLLSAFTMEGVKWVNDLELKYHKVASRAVETYPYAVAKGPKLVSDGMYPVPNIYGVMQCCSEYPAPLKVCRWDGWTRGLSDHSGTIWPGLDALSRGVEFLEVHFGAPDGPDGPVNLTPTQLKVLCDARDGFAAMRKD